MVLLLDVASLDLSIVYFSIEMGSHEKHMKSTHLGMRMDGFMVSFLSVLFKFLNLKK